jgi:predicted ATPase
MELAEVFSSVSRRQARLGRRRASVTRARKPRVEPSATADKRAYRFKHALIQDAAYDGLLKSRRQALHAQAAEILSESASPEPEAIAHHFTQAGLDDLAIEWWGKAGDQALRRSAFQEAIAHLSKAIAMADKGARWCGGRQAALPLRAAD